ncbi:L-threonylcarbamoyladenylate synthase [Balneola sp. MJW-20]|uniref:L-threonylcarbamoyladenylate synthase n=1 Tax=Gracilimonas aurantiaca TaxID=3234185 RepID=UPI0034666AA1
MIPESYISALKDGNVVAFPTETVYGLGASVWNEEAVKKIFELKGRPSDNPLIVHVSDLTQLRELASNVPDIANTLAKAFWPGPLTLILPKTDRVPDLVTAGLDTVALRMPDHPLAIALIRSVGPLVAPSANISGRPSPTSSKHVRDDFGDRIPVLDGGDTQLGLESTVLDLSGAQPLILRPGAIGPEEIRERTGIKVIYDDSDSDLKPRSPGQKYTHYKPKANISYGPVDGFRDDTLYLMQSGDSSSENIISYNGDLKTLSQELYRRFREADQLGYKNLHIDTIEDYKATFPSLYKALMNRIRKASG